MTTRDIHLRLAHAWWNAATQVPTEDYREACERGWEHFLKAKETA